MQLSRQGVRRSLGFRPSLESLEDRQCLSVTVSSLIGPQGRELKIVGDGGANSIQVADNGDGHVEVRNAKGALLGAADNVSVIRFNGKDGQDKINYTLTQPGSHTEAIYFNLGGGKDEATLDLSAGLNGGKLNITVNGGDGADAISAILGSLTAARLNLKLNGDAGADTISVSGDAADIDAESVLRIALSGDEGKDTLSTTYQGKVVGKLVVEADGGAGIDAIVANLTVAPESTGKLKGLARGQGGVDDVTLNVFTDADPEAPALETLDAKIVDRSALDTLTHTDNVNVVFEKAVTEKKIPVATV